MLVVLVLLATLLALVAVRAIVGVDDLEARIEQSPSAESSAIPFAGADERQLPDTASLLWQNDVDGVVANDGSSILVDGRSLVVGIFDVNVDVIPVGGAGSVMLGFDAATGEERWRTNLASDAGAFSLLGVLDGTLVLELLDTENRSVIGFDASTGEQQWERATGDPGVHVILDGSSVITRVSFTVNARLTFIEPGSGSEVGRVPGRLFATDFLGRWYVRNDERVSLIDLRDGYSEPVEVGTLGVTDGVAATVVDGQIVVIDGAGFARNSADATLSPLTISLGAGVEPPLGIRRFSPMVGSTFAFSGSDTFFGAELVGDEVEVSWSVDGGVIATSPTIRGLVFVVGAEGDLERRIVDGRTGTTLTTLGIADNAAEELISVGNGFVVKRRADLGFERVGLDLDGNEIWSLIGDGPISVGDRVVVSYGPGESGASVVAFGE